MTSEELENMLPQINLTVPQQSPVPLPEEKENMVSDELIMGLYSEGLDDIRKEREQLDSLIDTFVDMVINGGDSTTSSKEALVNLIKIKTDTSNNKTKILELMTRVKLKNTDTFPKYLNLHAQQTNNIAQPAEKREMIKTINKIVKKHKEQG